MSLVTAIPDVTEAAATDLASICSRIRAADAAAVLPTTGVPAAGAGEIARRQWPRCSTHTHARFVQLLNASAVEYAAAEAAALVWD